MHLFISAGHYTKDSGDIWNELRENEIAMLIRDELRRLCPDAFYPPDDLTLKETIEWINGRAEKEDFALEIHLNNSKTNIRGTEAYYFYDPRYAEIFSREVSKALGIPNRGPKSDTMSFMGELGFLRKLKCPSVLIECLYLSNESDRLALDVQKIAEGIKNGLDILFPKGIQKDIRKELLILKRQLDILWKLFELVKQKLGIK